jgi:hypothetical protein
MNFRLMITLVTFFLASPFAWSTNQFNLKCPPQAAVGAIAPAPAGWNIGAGFTILNSNAYMAQSTLLGCTYPDVNTNVATLYRAAPSGTTCATAGDGKTFNCTGGTTISCPAQTVVGYLLPMPTGWAGSGATNQSQGSTLVFSNYTYGGGTGVACNYKGYAGVLFQSTTPSGMTCVRAADAKSFDCTTPFVTSGSTPVSDLLPILDSPAFNWLASKIVFTNGNGSAYPYSAWTTTDRNRFKQLYQNMLAGTPLGVNCPNLSTQMVGRKLFSFRAQALDIYLAQLAHIFYIEATQKVSWSFMSFSYAMLTEFLGSKNLFSTIQPSVATGASYPSGIVVGTDFQSPFRTDAEGAPSIVCNPDIGYRMAAGLSTSAHQNLIGSTRDETLLNLSVWFGENVGHGGVPATPAAIAKIEDRLIAYEMSTGTPRGIVASDGCHGASNLFYDIARSINLPIVPASMVGTTLMNPVPPTASPAPSFSTFTHGALIYALGESGERGIQHMDDMYAMGNRTWSPISTGGSLLTYSQAKQIFFDTIWRTPANLTARGFPYQTSLPWVIPGTGWGLYQRSGGWEDRPDFGRFLGVWNADGSDQLKYGNAYYADQGYDLCRWQGYLQYYCEVPGGSVNWVQIISQPSTGPFRTPAQHTSHAAACVTAAGSCSALQATAAAFYSGTWGSDRVVSP